MTGLFQIGDKLLQAQDMPALLKRYQLMPQFLRGVILDQAIAPFTCTEEERKSAADNFLAQYQMTAPGAKENWLRGQNMSEEEFLDMVSRPLSIEKFKQHTWMPKVDNYFLTRKASLDHVVYSLLRTKNPALANELYFRILEGEQSFAEIARNFSEGPESKSDGLLGPVPLSQPHPAIGKLLSVSQPNQLWAPRPLAEWTVIIRLEKFMPAQLDDSMRRRLIDELFETWLNEQISTIGPLQPFSSVSSIS
jgi:parvulin-like peptidyl-prolyl isomerase